MSKQKACWNRTHPECPVKVPVMLRVELPSGIMAAEIGELQGGDCGAQVVIGGQEFEAMADGGVEPNAQEALNAAAERVLSDLRMVKTDWWQVQNWWEHVTARDRFLLFARLLMGEEALNLECTVIEFEVVP